MNNLEFIEKIKSNPVFDKIKKLQEMTKDEYLQRGYDKPYFDKGKDTGKSKWWHLYDNLYKQTPKFNFRLRDYEYGDFKWDVSLTVEMERLSIKKLEFVSRAYIYCDDFRYLLFHHPIKLEVFNIDNPIPDIQKAIKKIIVPEGYMGYLQVKYQILKNEIPYFYYKMVDRMKKEPVLDYDMLEKWLFKHFNIKCNGHIQEALKWLSTYGKPSSTVYFHKFDTSFTNYLDGDADELEGAFWDEMGNYEKNTVFI